ncbi:type II secretion system secretin GspD [Oceanospirillaceae bacterium]|nr:type II secretion system secretin GspD [Oceanospirillaceae bacterium]
MKHGFSLTLTTSMRFIIRTCLIFSFALVSASNCYAQGASLNLKNADIHSLIETVSIATGKNFIIDPRVQGNVTVISSGTVSSEELYQVFLSVLDVHGFIAAPSGTSIKIVPKVNARVSGTVTEVSNSAAAGDAIVTQIMALKHVPAVQVVPVIRPLLPQEAHLAAYLPSNMLILSDTARNAKRVWDMVRRIDQPLEQNLEIVQLKHATATEVVAIINNLGLNPNTLTGEGTAKNPIVIADQRTNTIIINAASDLLPRLRALIAHLDAPVAQMTGNTKVVYLHYSQAELLAPIIREMAAAHTSTDEADKADNTPQVLISVQAEPDINALVITAPDAALQSMLAVIKQLDVRRAQVLVEAIIAEISSSKAAELGVQWALGTNNIVGATSFGASGSNLIQLKANPLSLGSGLSLGVGQFAADQLGIGALLRALSSDASTNIISTPSLLTMDNQQAEIVVGQNVPFITGQYASTGSGETPSSPFQTIKRQDIGVRLQIKPQINQGDAISLEILQEISSLAPSTTSAADIITNKRSIQTTVIANDGDLIILGGLIDDNLQESSEKVPLLGDLPILGAAFRYKKSAMVKRNLMVFIRPTIVRDAAVLEAASHGKYTLLRTQQLLQSNDEVMLMPGVKRPVLEELNKPITLPEVNNKEPESEVKNTVNW